MGTSQNLRPSPIAGTWYPGDVAELSSSIEGYLSAIKQSEIKGQIKAIIVPHAGHRYSGSVAAYAYCAVRNMAVKNVAVISPMHQFHPGRILTTSHDAYTTPLGPVVVNRKLVHQLDQALETELGCKMTPISRDQEHSLEIQLPFLQRIYPAGFKLLPVMLRDQMPDTAQGLAKALNKVLPEGSLLVASSDLSHFYSENEARKLDATLLGAIRDFSAEELYQVEAESRGFACGLGAIATVLWAAQETGADRVEILKQATSGDVTGDRSSVVGYGSAVVYKSL